jgi:hypothetical protein
MGIAGLAVGLMILFWAFFVLIGLGGTAFWIWALVDVATKETDAENQKLIWVIIVIFGHFIGALIYLLVRRPQRIRELGR